MALRFSTRDLGLTVRMTVLTLAVVATGRPADMMSALVKLTGDDASIPNTDLRKLARVEALWVVATGRARFALFSDHPPLDKRLARLEEMSRTMGEPDGR